MAIDATKPSQLLKSQPTVAFLHDWPPPLTCLSYIFLCCIVNNREGKYLENVEIKHLNMIHLGVTGCKVWGVYCTLPRPLTTLFHSLMTTFTWLSSASFYLFSHTFLPFLSSILFTDSLLFLFLSPPLSFPLIIARKNSLYLFMFLIPPQLPKTLFLTLKKIFTVIFFSNCYIWYFYFLQYS